MAFVHCHKCNWEQDDFWDWGFRKYGYFHHWGYNPISCFLSHVFGGGWKGGLIYPRYIKYDPVLSKYPIRHSWIMIGVEFKRMLIKFRRQEWSTWTSYRKDPIKMCPKCHNEDLCID